MTQPMPPERWAAVTLLAALVFGSLMLRVQRDIYRPEVGPSAPLVIVHVVGDVPNPGVHIPAEAAPTVAHALAAAGWRPGKGGHLIPEGIEDLRLETGERIRVSRISENTSAVLLETMDGAERFVLGFKLDVNTASESDLMLVPGMKAEWARIIVERRKREPWKTLDELRSIHGVGVRTVEKWRPHLEAAPTPSISHAAPP